MSSGKSEGFVWKYPSAEQIARDLAQSGWPMGTLVCRNDKGALVAASGGSNACLLPEGTKVEVVPPEPAKPSGDVAPLYQAHATASGYSGGIFTSAAAVRHFRDGLGLPVREAVVTSEDLEKAARETRFRVVRNFAAAVAAALSTMQGQRLLAEHHIREDALRFPAFATARRAVAVASMEPTRPSATPGAAAIPSLLSWLRKYEDRRGASREPSAAAITYARNTFGEALQAIYERARSLP